MKTQFKLITLSFLAISVSACSQDLKNAKTESVLIYGNCGMCEESIESAAFVKNTSNADWDKDNKTAVVIYDSTKTSIDEILKRIAYAGYDNNIYLAPDEAYSKLPECCQYDRHKKSSAVNESAYLTGLTQIETETLEIQDSSSKGVNPLASVFDAYFGIKDALVKDDGAVASAKAKELLYAMDAVMMDALTHEVHMAWMKYMTMLIQDVTLIKGSKKLESQRAAFAGLSKNMYELMKIAKPDYQVYYDHCPMYNDGKGADWLSKESGIKNPFYGIQMLTCGSTTDTIK